MKIYVMKIQNQIRTAGLFVLALACTLFMVSCHRASQKTGEKMMEKALENATGGKANVDINGEKTVIETSAGKMEINGNANSWPSEIPGEVPEFKFGKIDAVTTSEMDGNKSWNIAYNDVEEGFLDKYDALLKEKGFETVTMKMGDKGGSITAESPKYNIFLMGGEGKISLAVMLKKEE
jgi:hypothetical protein